MDSSSSFSVVPQGAKVPPSSFQVHIPEKRIEEMQTLIQLSKIAPPTYESLQKDHRYGITTEWLTSAKNAWVDFEWRPVESHINSFPQFTYDIEGMTIHFLAAFSRKPNAIPVMLIHGWPGSFFEFLPFLSLIRDEYSPDSLPYHFIVPSLPGYTFSSGPPLDKNFDTKDVARIINQVMINLGFEDGYIAQGGDIGAKIGRILAVDHDACKAIHLNACFMSKPPEVSDASLSDIEKSGLERAKLFTSSGTGYLVEQGTRPSTIANVLSTNPLALLAWIGEKFVSWVDEPLPLDTVLASVTLYWLTDTFPRSIYHYRESFPPPKIMPAMDPRWYINKPLGFSYFPKELVPIPQSWIETTGNLVFWRQHEKGGHFAALEQPREFAEDIVAFAEQIWSLLHSQTS
ncbi:Alpha/Beta hydrolase protein [Xylogone sp. PMI_703]|nr:Alpha/Beta hydrolase protein [Xylogone sp. PMI_703]